MATLTCLLNWHEAQLYVIKSVEMKKVQVKAVNFIFEQKKISR